MMIIKLKQLIFLLVLLNSTIISIAQVERGTAFKGTNLQYGASVKATYEFNAHKRIHKLNGGHHHLRIGLNVGVGCAISKWLYPTYNVELQIYKGGFGSRERSLVKKDFYLSGDLINAFSLTLPLSLNTSYLFTVKNQNKLIDRYIPLYYFADFALPSLQNPYLSSFSLGTNYIIPFGEEKKMQRVGFFNLHIHNFQFSYYNDGGLGMGQIKKIKTGLGDREDRYYTGGGVFSYSFGLTQDLTLIELNFHKYTGFTENAFQISNELNLGSVNYKDVTQHYYNKGYIGFNIIGLGKGIGITTKFNNIYLGDIQHSIHYTGDYAYHEVPYKPSISIGGGYLCNKNLQPIK